MVLIIAGIAFFGVTIMRSFERWTKEFSNGSFMAHLFDQLLESERMSSPQRPKATTTKFHWILQDVFSYFFNYPQT